MRDRPGAVLARHFFASLFECGFLSDDGAESLKRALLGSLAVAMAIGLLLTRVFMGKYAALSAGSFDVYERAVVADHAFLIAVPMWIVAGAMGVVGHSLFPDRTDFCVLMAEPLPRSTIFGAKLVSLLLFGGLFAAGAHLALLPLTALTLMGTIRTGSFVAAATAFGVSSVIGSLFAALGMIAVHGLLVLVAPRGRLVVCSGAVRSVLVGALVLSLPLVARLPGTADAFASNAWWLPWAPPAWFVGLERWFLADPVHGTLAAAAGVATVVAFVVSVASYVVLYRRFDRVMLQTAPRQTGGAGDLPLTRWRGRKPVQHAIRRFASITLRRSVLHQSLVVGLLAAAGAFVLNSLMASSGWGEPLDTRRGEALIVTLLWAPMTMMFLATPAIRLALSVPLDLRSNWVFRMTEDIPGRGEVAAANVRIVFMLGVAVPLALIAPLQWRVLGPPALGVLVIEAMIGWLLVEWVMADWRRIPFTCSYIPGKGFVPHMFVKGLGSYVLFTLATGLVLRLSLALPRGAVIAALVIGAAAAGLGARRSRRARLASLTFDDELPADVTSLHLHAD